MKIVSLTMSVMCLLSATQGFAEISDRTDESGQPKERQYLYLAHPYKPTYFMPLYYTFTSHGGKRPRFGAHLLRATEVAFQISFKVPIWHRSPTSTGIYAAYTQQSFWQAYTKSPFFRSTDYAPELFIEQPLGPSKNGWRLIPKGGMVHQSNGEGGTLERSWNRVYGEMQLVKSPWEGHLQAWHIFRTAEMTKNNPDIGYYQGYGQISLHYHTLKHDVSLTARRSAVQFRWLFPLSPSLRGVLQAFSGNGPNLIAYKERTRSVGVGIALLE